MSTSDHLPPTLRQLALLRRLAERTGTTFTPPTDRQHASRQIDEMLQRPRSGRLERDLDYTAVRGGDLHDW